MPIKAPVAVRFESPIWNVAESLTDTIGYRVPVRLSEPPCTPLLNGWLESPHSKLVVNAVSKFDSAVAIWVSRIAGSYTDWSVPEPSELAMPAPAPVFNGVGSNPPIGMPWAPKAITRTISELSRPIRIASGKVIGQTSCASGSFVVRGFDTRGICIGSELLRRVAFLTSESSSAARPMLSWGTCLDSSI